MMHRVWLPGLVRLHVAARSQWVCAYACKAYAAQRRAALGSRARGWARKDCGRERRKVRGTTSVPRVATSRDGPEEVSGRISKRHERRGRQQDSGVPVKRP